LLYEREGIKTLSYPHAFFSYLVFELSL